MGYQNISGAITLTHLNNEEIHKNIGGLIFVSMLMITGLLGNLHVLVVFGKKMKPSTHRTFICVLAIVDLIGSTVGMPFVLVDLTHPLTFYMTAACKVLRMVNYFMGISSVFLMLVVTVDRYRKVCHPLKWQLSGKMAKVLSCIVLIFSVGLSWPTLILFGHITVELGNNNLTGVRCSTDDKYANSPYQTYFNAMLIIMVLIALVAHIVLYSIICGVIKNHNLHKLELKEIKSIRRGASCHNDNAVSTTEISIVSATESSTPLQSIKQHEKRNKKVHISSKYRMASVNEDKNEIAVHFKNNLKKFRETRRMTIIFFAIIVIFFISYVPHLILKVIVSSQKDFLARLSRPGIILYNTFIWCFFINNSANPIVYMFLDIKFRTEVKAFYKHMLIR